MSLVAYGASDESETSDVEESEAPQATDAGDHNDRAPADDGKISDEEDYVPTARIQDIEPSSSKVTNSSVGNIGFSSVYTPSTLSDLPTPKAPSTAAAGGGEGEDELEEEVKAKASQLADAPKPPPKKAKQPTRIVLPALTKDSDEEEEESQKKPKQPAAVGAAKGSRSGLFAVLPPPTHASRKQTNRPLIPYTLTKRPAASKPTPSTTTSSPATTSATTTTGIDDDLPSQKHQSAFNALTGYESDSDEEESGATSSNFFSIGSEASGTSGSSGLSVVKNSAPSLNDGEESGTRTSESVTSARKDSTDVQPSSSHSQLTSTPFKTVSDSPVSSSSTVLASASHTSADVAAEKTGMSSAGDDDESGSEEEEDENEVSSTVGVPLVDQDAPLNFSSALQGGSWATSSLTAPMLPEMYAAPVNSDAASYWQKQQHYAQEYAPEQQEASSSSNSDFHQYMEDEQFLRISGKRKRGQEDIQIIDANVDDYVDPSDLMKGITEESSYQPHRKKENMPSMQQRRKKQITYLAFQAKERELELKNAWSQNKMTKNQARSKYGF